MTWDHDPPPGARRGYHHGNLREALMKAALELIAAKGPAGFTFAEAARAAGVSPAAPYRHYRDRDSLMADVARRAFEQFEAKLSQAWAKGTPDPFKAFERVGHAYLGFARAEPAQYSAMFESGLSFQAFPDLHVAGDRAFNVLRDACSALIATMPEGKRPPVMMMALHIWAEAHGIASLFARGDEARRPIPMSPEDLLDAAVLIYLDGLGARPKPA
ncbi:MAG: TetR/AcrR family transcriptional regulator [Hyphomicrobium sp.]|uniref:TetR/AcrR family transcriptional regulator n=1 Tax=Hyphomicrobium sp. TaxID=82 RepID=UPI0035682966